MKTAILQCLQRLPVKTAKTFMMTKFKKKLKLQCHWKIVQIVRFSL